MSTPSNPEPNSPTGEPPVEPTLSLGEPADQSDARTATSTTEFPTTQLPSIEFPSTDFPSTELTNTELTNTEVTSTAQAPTIVETARPAEAAPDPEPQAPVRRGIRMRTVVFGLVLLAIAGSVLVGQLTEVSIDAGAVFLALMIGCGVLLIAGARRN